MLSGIDKSCYDHICTARPQIMQEDKSKTAACLKWGGRTWRSEDGKWWLGGRTGRCCGAAAVEVGST